MLYGTSDVDADFYRLIHRIAGDQLREEPAERRGHARHPFPALQWIAPRRGPEFPQDDEFVQVRCYDLTRAGFSFFLPIGPDFTKLVAGFGAPPRLIYVGAEVVRRASVLVHASGEVEPIDDADPPSCRETESNTARPMVLVSCRFTERLTKPGNRSLTPGGSGQ